jgi:hypothetical protein
MAIRQLRGIERRKISLQTKLLFDRFDRTFFNSLLAPCIGRTDRLLPSDTFKCPPFPGSNVQPSFAR